MRTARTAMNGVFESENLRETTKRDEDEIFCPQNYLSRAPGAIVASTDF